MIRFARRHPFWAIVFGFVAVMIASSIKPGIGGFLFLVWFGFVLFLLVQRRRHRGTPRPQPVDYGIPRPAQLFPAPFAALGQSFSPTVGPNYGHDAAAARIPIGPKLRFDALNRDHYTCQYCGAKGPQAGGAAMLEIDHRLPVALGGTNDPVNLLTSCADCNRGKGATRIDATDDPGRTLRDHQWETCRVSVQMTGDERRQTIVVSAMRYGSGKSYFIVKPKQFSFQVSLPPGSIRHLPSLEAYTLMLKDKDRWRLQNLLDLVDAKLKEEGWQQTAKREWRRMVR